MIILDKKQWKNRSLEMILTIFIFTLLLLFRNFVRCIDLLDILEIGATAFIIDFLTVVHEKKLVKDLVPIDKKQRFCKILYGIICLFIAILLLFIANKSVGSENDKIALIFLSFFEYFFLIASVICASHSIAFFVYSFFGEKILNYININNEESDKND